MDKLDPPRISGDDVNAYCPVCDCRSNFIRESGTFSPDRPYQLMRYFKQRPNKGSLTFLLLKCVTCQLGGFAVIYEYAQERELAEFHPTSVRHVQIPQAVPADIESEFSSAENCAGINEYRPAATMLRSTIEKVLTKHGYNQKVLCGKLEQLMKDRIITKPLAKQNKEIVRILGNDVLHEDWREVTPEEYAVAHKYTHRLIEAFYDDHESVVAELKELGNKIEVESFDEEASKEADE